MHSCRYKHTLTKVGTIISDGRHDNYESLMCIRDLVSTMQSVTVTTTNHASEFDFDAMYASLSDNSILQSSRFRKQIFEPCKLEEDPSVRVILSAIVGIIDLRIIGSAHPMLLGSSVICLRSMSVSVRPFTSMDIGLRRYSWRHS